jgi:hypothetical protein
MSVGRVRTAWLVVGLTALAGLFTLLITDVDEFEARTGLFDRLGTWAINGMLGVSALLGALAAASLFFPKKWGPKLGPGGALFGAVIALWFGYVLWQGGV